MSDTDNPTVSPFLASSLAAAAEQPAPTRDSSAEAMNRLRQPFDVTPARPVTEPRDET